MEFRAIMSLSFMVIVLNACTSQDVVENAHLDITGPDKYIGFVGEKVFVRKLPGKPLEKKELEVLLRMDSEFKVRYKVLNMVHGDYNAPYIDFTVFDHYGYPEFAMKDKVLIYLRAYPEGFYHVKYRYDTVHTTSDGRYAVCDPEVEKEFSNIIVEMDFEPEVACIRGAYVEDVYKAREEAFKSDERIRICTEKFKKEGGVTYDEEYFKRRNSCVADLKERGLPW